MQHVCTKGDVPGHVRTGRHIVTAGAIDTHIHLGSPQLPAMVATCGANAISGTVCDATTYGSIPRSTMRNLAMSTARLMPTAAPANNPLQPSQTLQSAERAAIVQALARNNGNVSATARELGVARAASPLACQHTWHNSSHTMARTTTAMMAPPQWGGAAHCRMPH